MIKATLILALAWCASRLLRNRPAAERHLLWVTALLCAALVPVIGPRIPDWQPPVAARLIAALPSIPQPRVFVGDHNTRGTTVHALGIESDFGPLNLALFVIWFAGSFFALCLLVRGALAVRRLAKLSQPMTGTTWEQTADALKVRLGIKRQVFLREGPHGSLPLTWGLFRPRVILPRDTRGWPKERTFAVLAHELMHIRRLDWLLQIAGEIVCAIYWFHPLFWIARKQLHLESERACDDAVIALGMDSHDYAQHLLDIARSLKRRQPAWSLGMAGQVHLERRLVSILKPSANRNALTRNKALIFVLAVLVLAIPIAAMRVPDAVTPPAFPAALDGQQHLPRVLIYTAPPLYSDEARKMGIEGSVKVEARIDQDGRAQDLRILHGLGYGLDENALLAVRSWQFTPSAPGAHNSILQLDIEFSLLSAELNDLIANDMAARVGPGVVPPGIIHRVEPRVPANPTGSAPAGAVLFDVVIQENGTPKIVRVLRSLSWQLDEAAIAALEEWRFSPATRSGVALKVRMNIEMTVSNNGGFHVDSTPAGHTVVRNHF